MTDYERVKAYYSKFDEQHRLDQAEGKLEFDVSMEILLKYLKPEEHILDLGGGAGKYALELSRQGYRVTLADLSERLLAQAEADMKENHIPPLAGIDAVNATDLSCYEDQSFDAVILFGPLYHLLEEEERVRCVREVKRVLKPGGVVFASFIPYLAGAVAIVDRALRNPDQVDVHNLTAVFETGKFTNRSDSGFQEGYYPPSERIMELIRETAQEPAIVETCGHAMYIGRKA